MIESGNLISVTEAAGKLGITRERVHQVMSGGSLPARRIGHTYVLNEADLALIADRKPGRPKKVADEAEMKKAGAVVQASARSKTKKKSGRW